MKEMRPNPSKHHFLPLNALTSHGLGSKLSSQTHKHGA